MQRVRALRRRLPVVVRPQAVAHRDQLESGSGQHDDRHDEDVRAAAGGRHQDHGGQEERKECHRHRKR